MTAALKDMVLTALGEAGGVAYLKRQADENPSAFLVLLGKVLPLLVTGEGGGPIEFAERLVRARERAGKARAA